MTFGPSFKENLAQLPPIDGLDRIELIDGAGAVVAVIPNEPGKQGSLAVYNYLRARFAALDAAAAVEGLTLFGEHVADARLQPGAHPNVDRLLGIAEAGAEPLCIEAHTRAA